MDALRVRWCGFALWTAGLMISPLTDVSGGSNVQAATYQTRNFSVTADRPEVAEKVGQAAETYRRQLATFWLGQPLPNWSKPCRLRVREGALGAGGQTTFQFARGEVLNWDMQVQGTLERILDSVLPHEVNHTIFACHFRRPLPRWADEGAATLFEHRSEQLKQLALLNDVIAKDRERFSLRHLLSMKDYPEGMRPMLILYAQGYALADFLVQQRGRQAYLKFLSDGERIGWEEAIRENFDHGGIESLERNWKGWVLAGMPKLTLPKEQMLAAVPTQQSAARVSSDSRRSSIQAPSPRPLPTAAAQASSGAPPMATVPSSDTRANTLIPATVPEFSERTPGSRPSGLELTGSVRPANESDPDGGFGRAVSAFESVHLPRERNVVSGSTPQWAGFPGQKKLF